MKLLKRYIVQVQDAAIRSSNCNNTMVQGRQAFLQQASTAKLEKGCQQASEPQNQLMHKNFFRHLQYKLQGANVII
jgi:hypothetical protein